LPKKFDDEDTGKHLYLNHPLVEGFAFACRSTNHRFGPTTAMILLFEHPTSMLGARAPNQLYGRFLACQGHPRAALDANDLLIRRVGAKHTVESHSQLARRRFHCAGGAEPLYFLPFFGIKRDLTTKAIQQTKANKEHLSHAPRESESACKRRRERFLILTIARELN
jgi:hypothetical protein